jgi:S1-C subfamily serine protease
MDSQLLAGRNGQVGWQLPVPVPQPQVVRDGGGFSIQPEGYLPVDPFDERGVMRPLLGVFVMSNDANDQGRGARVTAVLRQTPADRAGLEAGDFIVAINGRPVDAESLRTTVRHHRVGDKVELKVLHGGDLRKMTIVLGQGL